MRTRKNLSSILGMIILFASVLFSGCKKDYPDSTYDVRFAINTVKVDKPDDGLKSGTIDLTQLVYLKSKNPQEVTHVKIGIDGTHEVPIINETLEYNVNDGVTEPIKLGTGDHTLVLIELLKEISPDVYEVMYSGVAEGAPLSEFVSTTLPIGFHIPLLGSVPVNVDVVALDEWLPADFGWALFNIGFVSANPLYFYGAQDDGTPSVMSMEVLNSDDEVISTGNTTAEGWLKVLYPDYYSISNTIETYTFNLLKDGILYSRDFTVEELLALPHEVLLLNVYSSGMMGFMPVPVERTFTINYRDDMGTNQGLAKVELFDMSNNLLYTSGSYSYGPYVIPYIDNLLIDNDVETYNIKFTRALNDNQSVSQVTSVAHMIATPVVEFYWLNSGTIVTWW